jgi:hypothetical protein
MAKIVETIKSAIQQQKELLLKIKYGLGSELEILLEPYIYGEDIMQYEFVWGCINQNKTFYKVYLNIILEATINEEVFPIVLNAVYLYSTGESHFEILDGFDNFYGQSNEPIQMI